MWEYIHHKGCIPCTKLVDFQDLIGVCQIQNKGTFINFMESKHDAHILHLFGMRQCGSVRVCMVKTLKVLCQLAIITIVIYYTLPAQTVW